MSPRRGVARSPRVPWPRTQRVLAASLAGVAVIVFLLAISIGSPRSWIRDQYTPVSRDDATGGEVLRSDKSVSATAAQIRERWKPASQVIDPSGVFLRYHDLIVAVTPRAEGGSTVHLDDERHGYAHWYGYVGGNWGVGSPVDGTRGGGPGSGK